MTTYHTIDCRWDPDTDPNSLGRCDDPDHPSRTTQRRLRRLMEMLLYSGGGGALTDAYKIVAAYPFLLPEYALKLKERSAEIRRQKTLERLRARRRPRAA